MKVTADYLHPIALILLTKAHVAVPVALRHAGMVHHEEVHLKMLGAGPPDLVMVRANVLDHLDTTAGAGGGGRHVCLKQQCLK